MLPNTHTSCSKQQLMRRWSVRQQQVGSHAAAAPVAHQLPGYSHRYAAVHHPLLQQNM